MGSLYKSLIDIDKTDLFIYAAIVILTVFIVARIAPSATVIVGLVVGIIVVYFLYDKNTTEQSDYVHKIISILTSPTLEPKKNTYLYRDSLIVEFLDKYKEYYGYNPQTYDSLVSQLNAMLQTSYVIEHDSVNYTHDYERLLDLKTKILNTFHSFIYRVPHTQMHLQKFHTGDTQLKELLNDHIDRTNRIVLTRSEKDGINVHSKFHYKSHPKPTDPGWTESSYYS